MRVTVQGVNGITDGTYYLGKDPNGNIERLCVAVRANGQCYKPAGSGSSSGGDSSSSSSGGSSGTVDCSAINVHPNWTQNDWAGTPSHASEGDKMQYNGIAYRARNWTQTRPGDSADWILVGSCI